MENKNLTAVEWLVKEISSVLGPIKTEPMQDLLLLDAIQKAKQMEKEQIEDAYMEGAEKQSLYPSKSAVQYYTKTYGK